MILTNIINTRPDNMNVSGGTAWPCRRADATEYRTTMSYLIQQQQQQQQQ